MGTFSLLFAAAIVAGDTAPDFEVTSISGETLHLEQMVKDGPVILAFFPKAFTSG